MSELKCPFCQQEMRRTNGTHNKVGVWQCQNSNDPDNVCIASGYLFNDDVLNYINRTRKALDVAVDAMKEQQRWFGVIRVSLISHLNNQYGTLFKSYDADPTVVNIKRANDMLNTAIKEITTLEQKDVK